MASNRNDQRTLPGVDKPIKIQSLVPYDPLQNVLSVISSPQPSTSSSQDSTEEKSICRVASAASHEAKIEPWNVYSWNSTDNHPEIQMHPSVKGGRSTSHGPDYHRHLAMLLNLKAYKQFTTELYEVSVEDTRYGKFDDFVIKVINKKGESLLQCIQIKHSLDESSKLTLAHLLSKAGEPLSIKLYFDSYIKIQSELENITRVMLILYTNRKLKFGDTVSNFKLSKSVFKKPSCKFLSKSSYLLQFENEFTGRDILIDHLTNGEHSKQEIAKSFLQHFYIAHGQYSDSEVISEIISEFKSAEFSNCETVFATHESNILNWFKMKGKNQGIILNNKHIKIYFDSLKIKHTSTIVKEFSKNFNLISTLLQYCNDTLISKIPDHELKSNVIIKNGLLQKIELTIITEKYDQKMNFQFTHNQIIVMNTKDTNAKILKFYNSGYSLYNQFVETMCKYFVLNYVAAYFILEISQLMETHLPNINYKKKNNKT